VVGGVALAGVMIHPTDYHMPSKPARRGHAPATQRAPGSWQTPNQPPRRRDVAIDKKAVDLLMRSEAAPFCITQGLSTRLKNGCGVVMAAHARAVERPKRCRWPLWGAVQAHSVAGLAGRL
jgi:hypothetical protein